MRDVLVRAGAIAWKDLLIEARTKQSFNAMVFFAALVLFIFSFIMPPELLARGFADFRFDREEWKVKLHDERADHAEFLREQGHDEQSTKHLQNVVWFGSPVIGMTAAIFSTVGFVWILKRTGEAAGQLGAGIRRRRKEYAQRDVERMSLAGHQTSVVSTQQSASRMSTADR